MSYTKGPWSVQGGMVWASIRKNGSNGHEYIESAIVADTWHSNKISENDKESNSHLVASAPELLEALRDIHQLAWDAIENMTDEEKFRLDSANRIISKALGK